MKRERLIGVVTGAHVLVIGGLLLSQGCGTTRAPLPPEDDYVMPPRIQEETYRAPTPSAPLHRPAPAPAFVPETVTPPAETTTYVVAKGDALSVIAKRYNVSLHEVMRINNISDPDVIRVGQRILLPGRINLDRPAQVTPARAAAAPSAPAGAERYVVQAGDSLSVIAQRTGTNVQELMRLNNISNANVIRVGQELVLPAGARQGTQQRQAPSTTRVPVPPRDAAAPSPRPATPAPADPMPSFGDAPAAPAAEAALLPPARAERAAPQTYTVQIGDDLISVASEFNVSISALREVNEIESNILVPGRTLIIPDVD